MESLSRQLREFSAEAANAYAQTRAVPANALAVLRSRAMGPYTVALESGDPALPGLVQAIETMKPGKLKSLLSEFALRLPWIGNEASLPGGRRRHTAYVEIVGPDGYALCDSLRFGLFFQGPHSVYPAHSHAAEEVYYVLGGDALWQKDDGAFCIISPGSLIHHAPWQRHAMTAASQPLLAMWVWLGDLDMARYKLDEMQGV